MVREPLDLLAEAIAMEHLDRVHETCVKIATPLLQEASVRDLVRERVLERVLEIREQPRLVEQLGGLQVGEPAPQLFFSEVGHRQQKRERHALADDRGCLEQPFVLGRQTIDARRKDRLDRRRHLGRRGVAGELIGPAFAGEGLGLHQRSHAFLEEQRVAFGPGHERALERVEARVGAESRRSCR